MPLRTIIWLLASLGILIALSARAEVRIGVATLVTGPFEPIGNTLYGYAAIQAWAQAVEAAGSFQTDAVAATLRGQKFDTVLGRIGFDAKGDVTGYDIFVWYVWSNGTYLPLESGAAKE